jgi:L-threonylcarbamoyladenylate synthase
VSDVDAAAFERCMSVGGVAVFPSDTVYGLACDAQNEVAVRRLYALKRRPLVKPSAVMFFDPELALAALPELGQRTRGAFERLLPGPVTALIPNPAGRFPLACGGDSATLGVRVPVVRVLGEVRWPVLQSSANLAGGPEARRLSEVPEPIRRAVDMVIDGGELPGTASTVIDLRAFERQGDWRIVRHGAVDEADVRAALEGQFHFDPASYPDEVREDIPVYDEFQAQVVAACGDGFARVLELGTGTGETAARLLEVRPEAELVGIDESEAMLEVARARLGSGVRLDVARLQDPLPDGPFDLVASALCVYHLDGDEKRSLFERIARVLRAGGRFVLGDVVIPVDPADAVTALIPGFDRPSTLADQLQWLAEARLEPRVTWQHRDLAVVCCAAGGDATIGAP